MIEMTKWVTCERLSPTQFEWGCVLGARCNLFDEREAPSFDSERAADVTSLTRGVPAFAGGSFVWLPAQTVVRLALLRQKRVARDV